MGIQPLHGLEVGGRELAFDDSERRAGLHPQPGNTEDYYAKAVVNNENCYTKQRKLLHENNCYLGI